MATPHDALFKAVFSQAEHAVGELRHVLPAAVARHVDWGSLELLSGSFVDAELRDSHADLLYRVQLAGRDAYVYLLLEHKSSADCWTPFQMLVYVVRIWQRFRREQPGAAKVPPVIPVVVHHGEAGWTCGAELSDLIDLDPEAREDVEAFQPALRLLIDDLAQESSEQLASRAASALGRLALFCLYRARGSGDLIAELRPWRDAMREVMVAPDGASALATVLSYIIRVQNPPLDVMKRFLRVEVGPESEQTMTTTYDQLLNQGRAEILLEQLVERFGALTEAVEQRVRGGTLDELRIWARRVLTVSTLDEVFGSD